jgi:hypothetical protein
MLGFWSNPEDGDPVAIGDRIVAALAAAGLDASWDGTDQQRIEVALTWRVRVEDSAVSIT